MEDTSSNESGRNIRGSATSSRRVLMAAGASWALGAAGLYLPESINEAAARGTLGGAMGGRHGKDHRGRDKHRKQNQNDNNNGHARDQGIFVGKGCSATFSNQSSVTINASVVATINALANVDGNVDMEPGFYGNIGKSNDELRLQLFRFAISIQIATSMDFNNPFIGAPTVDCYDGVKTDEQHSLSEGDSFTYVSGDGSGTYVVERLADSDDYKEFRVTALA